MESNSDEKPTTVSAGMDSISGEEFGGSEATRGFRFNLTPGRELGLNERRREERMESEAKSRSSGSGSPQEMVLELSTLERSNREALRDLDEAIATYSKGKHSISVLTSLDKVKLSLELQSEVGSNLKRGVIHAVESLQSLRRDFGDLRDIVSQVWQVVEERQVEESLREGDMLARLSQLEESRSRRMGSDENREIRVFSGKEFKSTVSRFSGFVDSISTADKVNQRVAFRKWEEDLREYALLSRLGMSVELIMNSLGEEPRTILRAWDGFEGSVGHTVAVMAAAKAEKAMS